jgi:hypothetical protein
MRAPVAPLLVAFLFVSPRGSAYYYCTDIIVTHPAQGPGSCTRVLKYKYCISLNEMNL